MNERVNKLSEETSLYLRQHAENPVHWQPWDEATLEMARQENRPILLSIGYSACHWCHVMAHESFEDQATAEIMNSLFINIKLDREERPDLDKLYQLSHQLLTGRGGGWPLTVFLEPTELVPFFAGTYFPSNRRYGMASFTEVLQAVGRWYEENRDEVRNQNKQLLEALDAINSPAAGSAAAAGEMKNLTVDAGQQLLQRFDAVNGGFGQAPKFPQAPLLTAAAIIGTQSQNKALESALRFSLSKMAASGLRDHLDGGFFRYCVDATWTIPHFEKMLYDNAQLLPIYAAYAAEDTDSVFGAVAEGIVSWLESEMSQVDGAYAASIDADADGEEGSFHVWTPEQVHQHLNEDADDFIAVFGLDQPPNFEGKSWHLVAGERLGLVVGQDNSSLPESIHRLRQARESRIHPSLDPKRITSWNALLAGGLVKAATHMKRDDWLDRAESILDFIYKNSWQGGQLQAVHDQGRSRFTAYLDDYAFLLEAILDLLQQRWNRNRLDWAIELAEILLARFEDNESGGFYFTDVNSGVPMGRSLSFHDDATPAGNAYAANALLRLGGLIGEPRYDESAQRCLGRGMDPLRQSPLAASSLFAPLLRLSGGSAQILLCGQNLEAQLELQSWIRENYQVDCYVIGAPDSSLPGTLGSLQTETDWTAWLCRGTRCLPPVSDPDTLAELLEQD